MEFKHNDYNVVVIDPPWPVKKIKRKVAPNQVDMDYKTMNLKDIAAIKPPMAKEGCHLFLWTTQKYLPSALDIIKKWGCRYILTFVWHKPGGFQPFGLPQYNCEFVVYARYGSPPKFSSLKAFPACFNGKRGAHSEKPEEFYSMIRRVTEGCTRLDMYNRRQIEGFDGWGDESPE